MCKMRPGLHVLARLIEEIYDALIEAGASEGKARAAARAMTNYETRISKIESDINLDQPITGGIGLAQKKVRAIALDQRREWISEHTELSLRQQCRLTGVSRAGLDYA